ncbi:MAG: SOS response-associated peptidase [Bacteroidales bacterium]|jgi:putative SOS response-associated peptidase YedK|nr:SOS response-associated peptidase [Bacteroidales bacterium]MDN5350321.1 hypothetical protein [Bacteroidales bacterium]
MCGRFQLSVKGKTISERFNVEVFDEKYKPSYNCAPGQYLPVITNENPGILQWFFWGFTPAWAANRADIKPQINSRSESLETKASFKQAAQQHRCLIPASGYYEWQTKGSKQAFHIFLKNNPLFAFAGIWESYQTAKGELLNSFCIITKAASKQLSAIHHRMPVMLTQNKERDWLWADSEEKRKQLFDTISDEDLGFTPVSTRVNDVRNDDETLLKPWTFPEQQSLF